MLGRNVSNKKASLIINVGSKDRRNPTTEVRGDFLFGLSRLGINTPPNAATTVRVVGGFVSLDGSVFIKDARRSVKIVVDNLPTTYVQTLQCNCGPAGTVLGTVDFREQQTTFARIISGDQPVIQLMSGVSLPDIRVRLLTSQNTIYEPATDWHILLAFDTDEQVTADRIISAVTS